MRTVAIVQARLNSRRFPRKVLADVCGEPAIARLLRNLKTCKRLDEVVLATSGDGWTFYDIVINSAVGWFAAIGMPENDVLRRYACCAELCEADVIVRITADCPLLDPALVDEAVDAYEGQGYFHIKGYPRGVGDIELFSRAALMAADAAATDPEEREHVWAAVAAQGPMSLRMCPEALYRPQDRLCLDEPADLDAIRATMLALGNPPVAGVADIVRVLDERPDIRALNAHVAQVSA